MDPATIAFTVAGLLAKNAAEAAAGEAGKGAWAAFGRIAEVVRSRFHGDQEATEALDRLEAKPTREGRARELAEVLSERLASDAALTAELARLVEEARTRPQTSSFVTMVQDNAKVGQIINIESISGRVEF